MTNTVMVNDRSLASYIDHTILKPDAQRVEVERLCDEAIRFKFASVCVNPYWVPLVAQKLKGSGVLTCCVVGFPLGATLSECKAQETQACIQNGADEVDMVINVGALKDGDLDLVRDDIALVKKACAGKTLKVIIETCLLTDAQKETACRLSVEAGADFVKTSTGFGKSGATVADIALMRQTVGPLVGVKASGGVRSQADALAMIEAGASRVGASLSVTIIGA
ncbi:deoxyribose-phosphate aldolase [Rhodoferax fermentans]|nr:deoxyribose-phosphate aldolase [Rhodoferax fermentans]